MEPNINVTVLGYAALHPTYGSYRDLRIHGISAIAPLWRNLFLYGDRYSMMG
ncbi:MAG: hypothetical protein HC810_08145 [Acaryochloridaceae cyanobacterium RL_2_7]|nr:hypothetical protein [Acaryochloridaceae cyanobacterium RL_2_7]